jgi:hypothetical protein
MEIEGSNGGSDVYRDFDTYLGEYFTLSVSYSPRNGHLSGVDSAIEVYWEGQKIGTLNATSTGLQTYTFNVTANSASGKSRLQFHSVDCDSYGGVIDNVRLQGIGYAENTAVPFQVGAALSDIDGSEQLAISVKGVPAGARLTDGVHTFSATAGSTVADITGWNLGSLSFLPPQEAGGTFSLLVVATSSETATGGTASIVVTLPLKIIATNDAPVAQASTVTGKEDAAYVFAWSDFQASDVDNIALALTVTTLPASGKLQRFDGSSWIAVTAGQAVARADIEAGKLRFVPGSHASGSPAFASTGFGNRKQHYAHFNYQVNDEQLSSAVVAMTVDIVPVVDVPSLALSSDGVGASQVLFRTDWETAPDLNSGSTLVQQSTYEGWTLVTSPDGYIRRMPMEMW